MLELLEFLKDYGGVILGFGLLAASSLFLPKKIRKYVLTAGLAILVFRTFQIYQNKKALKEADAERDRLRELNKQLDGKLNELQGEAEKLRTEKSEIETKAAELKAESAALDDSSNETLEKKKALDADANKLIDQAKELEEQQRAQANTLNKAAEISKQFSSDWLTQGQN